MNNKQISLTMFYIGILIGLVISKTNLPITWTTIFYVSVYFVIINFVKLQKVLIFCLITSSIIWLPTTWVFGSFKWYDPILFLYLFGVLFSDFFSKERNEPLFVNYGDITRFPVETVPDNIKPID